MAGASLTIQEAAHTTGWSARMLRYIEEAGLVMPERSPASYRLYGPAELQRLRTLRDLLEEYGIELSEVGFALRLQSDAKLSEAVEAWLAAPAVRPAEISAHDWLAFEQEKHLQ
ncbi:MAG: MerR family transcriptional regulator, partial [Acidimicrobiales bacterium]